MATPIHTTTDAGNFSAALSNAWNISAQWEGVAHSMATILGQWIDEGEFADIKDLKQRASAILDKYESMEHLQS